MNAPPSRAGLRGRAGEVRYLRDFLAALAAAFAVWLASTGRAPALRVVLAADVFFAACVGQMIHQAIRLDAEALRARGGVSRGGGVAVLALTSAAMISGIVAIFLLLNHDGPGQTPFGIVAVASVPLAWVTMHAHAAFHYAKLYYGRDPLGRPSGGLRFPDGADPDALDFLYYALVIGVATSVSDVSITSRRMRAATMAHSVLAFAFNSVILAIAVNATLTFAG